MQSPIDLRLGKWGFCNGDGSRLSVCYHRSEPKPSSITFNQPTDVPYLSWRLTESGRVSSATAQRRWLYLSVGTATTPASSMAASQPSTRNPLCLDDPQHAQVRGDFIWRSIRPPDFRPTPLSFSSWKQAAVQQDACWQTFSNPGRTAYPCGEHLFLGLGYPTKF